jgi:hypothetical protein
MLATMQRMLQKLTRSPSAAQFPHPEWKTPLLLSTKVVNACRPELLAVKEMLLDPRRPVSAAAVQQPKAFLSASSWKFLGECHAASASCCFSSSRRSRSCRSALVKRQSNGTAVCS